VIDGRRTGSGRLGVDDRRGGRGSALAATGKGEAMEAAPAGRSLAHPDTVAADLLTFGCRGMLPLGRSKRQLKLPRWYKSPRRPDTASWSSPLEHNTDFLGGKSQDTAANGGSISEHRGGAGRQLGVRRAELTGVSGGHH
jgi:hypothetical protein